MTTDKLNIPDDLAEKLARLGAEAAERPKKIEDEIKKIEDTIGKRRAAQTGFALGASVLIQREEDQIGTLDHEREQIDHEREQINKIRARARRMLGMSDDTGNGSDDEQGNPPTDQPIHAEFTSHYQGYVKGRGHRFLFDASASTGSGDLTFSWDSGDQRTLDDLPNSRLELFYAREGAYLVILRVTDSQGRSDLFRMTVQVPRVPDDGTQIMPPPPPPAATDTARRHRWPLALLWVVVVFVLALIIWAIVAPHAANDAHWATQWWTYLVIPLLFGTGAGLVAYDKEE